MPRVIVLVVVLLTAHVSAADPMPAENLRPMHPWIVDALAYGTRASQTMARLVDEVAGMPVIVHVDEASGPRQGWDGRIRFVGVSGPWLFLRIDIRRHDLPTTAAILAHELQHVLEVHASGVHSTAEFEALYRRTGVRNASGAEQYDTPAAVAAGERTLRELATAALLAGPGSEGWPCGRRRCGSSNRDEEVAGRLRGRRGRVTSPF